VLLVLLLLLAVPSALANDTSVHSLQSGSPSGPMRLFENGLHGEGQVIAILDTGLDYDSCFFAEDDGTPPPVNRVDPSRRKVIAYNLLWTGDSVGDNHGHGTHTAGAAVADRGARGVYDSSDAIAPAAKLVVQDAGFVDGPCSLPGLGCPARDLRPVLLQAWQQGARIHSNSWGDRRADYSTSAAEIDDFVHQHPDMLVIFNAGNAGAAGPSSVSSPGVAKNAIQVGGTRASVDLTDFTLSSFSGRGPSRDGRIKPDLVGPAIVRAADTDFDPASRNCNVSTQAGTSWSAPTIAGAAALVRQYYADGYYPSGRPLVSDRMASPSAALIKATLIASARRVPWRENGSATDPVPSFEQGFGFPVLDDALYFASDTTRLRIVEGSIGAGETFSVPFGVSTGGSLKAVLVWTDPPAAPRGSTDTSPVLVHDLDLTVDGTGPRDRLNNVEVVAITGASAAPHVVAVSAQRIAAGARQRFALVVTGDLIEVSRRRPARR
jgi:hypothetical protein